MIDDDIAQKNTCQKCENYTEHLQEILHNDFFPEYLQYNTVYKLYT